MPAGETFRICAWLGIALESVPECILIAYLRQLGMQGFVRALLTRSLCGFSLGKVALNGALNGAGVATFGDTGQLVSQSSTLPNEQ